MSDFSHVPRVLTAIRRGKTMTSVSEDHPVALFAFVNLHIVFSDSHGCST